jgi:hypothetical protein
MTQPRQSCSCTVPGVYLLGLVFLIVGLLALVIW